MMLSAQQNVAETEALVNQIKSADWYSETPSASLLQTSPKKENNLIQMIARRRASTNDCNAFGLSPIDIDTNTVVDPTASAPALVDPLGFRFMSQSESEMTPHVQITQMHSHFRVEVPQDSQEWPLGGVLSDKTLRGVSYVDIQVPGKHSVNGRVPAAELQLVHESINGKPAVAVSVPLEVEDSDHENEWLQPLLAALPQKNNVQSVVGKPMGLAHELLGKGVTSRYYRYDGTSTTPPCHQTEWFVLAEPGRVGKSQLSQLKSALGISEHLRPEASIFKAKVVMLGSSHLADQASVLAAGRSGVTTPGSRVLLSRVRAQQVGM
jgi:carbonic anhydrase